MSTNNNVNRTPELTPPFGAMACLKCDRGSDLTAPQAIAVGWINVEDCHDGLTRTHLGLCPFCLAEEAEELRIQSDLLKGEVTRLRDALKIHRHTEECFQYAGKTASRHGNFYCIVKCADSWRDAMKEHIEQCPQHSMFEVKAENARLRRIVDTLPKDQNGKPIYPGATVRTETDELGVVGLPYLIIVDMKIACHEIPRNRLEVVEEGADAQSPT